MAFSDAPYKLRCIYMGRHFYWGNGYKAHQKLNVLCGGGILFLLVPFQGTDGGAVALGGIYGSFGRKDHLVECGCKKIANFRVLNENPE